MKHFITLLLLFVTFAAVAQTTPETTDVQQATMERFAAVQTIQSNFTQEKHLSLLTAPVISKGTFAFTKTPSRLRWENTEPFQNGFLLLENETFRLEKGLKKPIKHAMASQVATQMKMWLTFDLAALSKAHTLDFFDGGVRLTPKKENGIFIEITVWFSKQNPQALEKIRLNETNGDYTLLTFTNTKINEPISEENF